LRPLISITDKLAFDVSEWASSYNPISSVISLFFDILRFSMPWFTVKHFAKSTNPASENAFLLISNIFRVLLS